ncbi:hypothetical protein GGP98_003240 [Salinibacter ruber]|jgi:hypothetical protein|nr:hypothetical protein [Salinibacter ruber]MCS4103267.1 hypothetical protein [Salinibacter ruber]
MLNLEERIVLNLKEKDGRSTRAGQLQAKRKSLPRRRL